MGLFGGAPSSGQKNYFGGIAQAFCLGPVKTLYQLRNGDTVIWTGPIDSSTADGNGKSVLTTTIGTVNFYWGNSTQGQDPILAAALINLGTGAQTVPIPSWPHLCYITGTNISFGSQQSPPVITAELEVETSGLSISAHRIRSLDGAIPVTIGDDLQTVSEENASRSIGDQVIFGGTTVPAGLTAGTAYYVVSVSTSGTTTTFKVSSTLGGSAITFGDAGSAVTVQGASYDGVIPEIIYNWLTSAVYSIGIDPATYIDTASFEACAETVITEGIGVSPTIDATSDLREIIGKLLQYVDGIIYWSTGKLSMKLIRAESTSGLPTATAADMLEEPEPTNEGEAETWNMTDIGFTDRGNNYETTSEPYDDAANADIFDQDRQKVVNLPYIKTRGVAKILAKLIGVKGGLVPMSWVLHLKPSWATLKPGDRFFVSYTKTGFDSRLVRVTSVDVGTPENPEVIVAVSEEATRDTSHDYIPADDEFGFRGFYTDDGENIHKLTGSTARLSEIPSGLVNADPDGFLVAMARPDSTASGFKAYFTWDPNLSPYKQVGQQKSWAAKGTVLCYHRIRSTHWLLRVQMATTTDYDYLVSMLGSYDLYAVCGERLVKLIGTAQDQHQVTAMWALSKEYSNLLTGSIIDIEVDSGYFGTDAMVLETIAAPAKAPTQDVFFGQQSDFLIVHSSSIQFSRNNPNAAADSNKKRYVKAPIWKGADVQAVEDATEVYFDRDDTTMCPNGTFSQTWGNRARTTYEVLDISGGNKALRTTDSDYATISDLDQALGDILLGTPTSTQTLLAADIDTVLGEMVATTNRIYNDSP